MRLKIKKINFGKIMDSSFFQKGMLLLAFLLAKLNIFAQDKVGVGSALSDIAGEIKGYQTAVKNILYAIAALIALVGAFNIFHKMTNGDQDVKKTIMLTIGGCIGFIALATALPGIFGVN